MALVSFLSGGYKLHRFSDAIGLVLNTELLKISAMGSLVSSEILSNAELIHELL